MSEVRFIPPVKVALPKATLDPCLVEIDNPRDAITALNRHGVGGFRIDSHIWQITSERLARAVRNPTPENVEGARQAFQQLVYELS